MTEWGWRIPILIGCAIIPLFLLLRRSLEETEVFARQTTHPRMGEIYRSILANWKIIVAGMLLVANASGTFYFITVYTPRCGQAAAHLDTDDNLLVTLFVGMSNLLWHPISGALSDRIGRNPVIITPPPMAIGTTYPPFLWLPQ